jgi:hypothetical protein
MIACCCKSKSSTTLKFSFFNWVVKYFYVKYLKKYIKIIPLNAEDKLTAVSLAY